MKKILQFILLEFKILFRVPISLFFTLLFPQMLLFTFVLVSRNPNVYGDIYFVDVYLPLMIVMSMMSNGIVSFSVIVGGNRGEKVWNVYRMKGFKLWQIIVSQLSVNIILQLISSVLLILSASIFFKANIIFENLVQFWLWWCINSIAITLIGFVIGVYCKNEKIAQAISTPIMFVLMIFSGQMVQLSEFPDVIRNISSFIPTTQASAILSEFWTGLESNYIQIRWYIPLVSIILSLIIVICRLNKDQF